MNLFRAQGIHGLTRFQITRAPICSRSFTLTACRRQFQQESPSLNEPTWQPDHKPIPESPSFYTTRAAYNDQVIHLERAVSSSEQFLRSHHLLPLPDFAKASLPMLPAVWKEQAEMAKEFRMKMTTTRYRRVTKLLNQLNDFQRIANTGGCPQLGQKLADILAMYESSKKDAFLARGKRKPVVLDEYGRSYTLGKRKTSSARVWMIPVQTQPSASTPSPEALLGVPESQPQPLVTTSTILVNNLPLNEFFRLPADRERVTRPLKVAGILSKYNVFSIIRGGGLSGQSGALAHGIAKGVVAHEPELETMFRRSKLTRRDPRMVERKKTGLAKARKRYTWVKR
ncbi:ribosomal protein S9/S16-domain-containing protein [Panaeolus papilionaceus]|nr:ribosomal protein S9/S16-domain-containing protein [Panaeolus papilionaceus]